MSSTELLRLAKGKKPGNKIFGQFIAIGESSRIIGYKRKNVHRDGRVQAPMFS